MSARMRCGVLASLCLAMAAPLSAAPAATRAVATVEGDVTGVWQGGIAVFRGVPYAAAPEGALRWRPPQAAPHRAGVLDAAPFGSVCPQSQRASPYLAGLPMGEDCLKLNVYAPGGAFEGGERVPVMVWIHGGSFRWGAGSWPGAEPFALVHRGVIVVTINYRLGRLGLFAHPALSASMPDEPVANYALMDQIAALRWVRDNIAAFGGDPARVTIFGQSAGGISVTTLMAVPSARSLFRGAIAQSGASGRPTTARHASAVQLEADGLRWRRASTSRMTQSAGGAARCPSPSARVFRKGNSEFDEPGGRGRVLPDDISHFRSGRQQPVPFLTGTTSFRRHPRIVPVQARGHAARRGPCGGSPCLRRLRDRAW